MSMSLGGMALVTTMAAWQDKNLIYLILMISGLAGVREILMMMWGIWMTWELMMRCAEVASKSECSCSQWSLVMIHKMKTGFHQSYGTIKQRSRLVLPKFHCELNPIEMYCGWCKYHSQQAPKNTFDGAKKATCGF
ncbi:hypothetical protein P691DRAFT_788708 [Macrolepiota fuliginosa MF-IS2]|uniref:Uncharacterized protein n=1 Tax=Macrolepiota fuliginosa MF-IS2 TaxID=1400762 RepID=A0A9P5X4X5_9AGAR|nr:hypothetical protein P691DRAFT_788708 [Macrolepiota fuliginosa MF-IS2]